MARTRTLLVGVLMVLTACSARADPHSPPPAPGAPASAGAAPYRLTASGAFEALRSGPPPRGFTVRLTCRSRDADGCARQGTAKTRWLVGTQSHGARLPRGNGLVEFVRTIVLAWPSAAAARSYAEGLTRQLEHYRGEYDIAVKKTGPRTYRPGDRGRGELQTVSMRGWRGTGLRRVFHYVFDGLSPSANVFGGRFVLRRARYVVDLEWAARNQHTDRRLSHLPRRLLRGVG